MPLSEYIISADFLKTAAPAVVTALFTYIATRAKEKSDRKRILEERDIQIQKEREEREERDRVHEAEREDREATRAASEFEKIIAANTTFQNTIRAELDNAKSRINELENRLQLKDTEIIGLKQSINDLSAEVEAKETVISDLKNSVYERDILINELRIRINKVELASTPDISTNSTNFPKSTPTVQ